ncbi:putative membrane protein [Dehalobacter sp. UNSWDHB]|uniref:hypothetical protein n=1 Tax=Dehalobacter sp. UNSWDHB TaxID=1339256 RepID=UPI00038CCF17|nr:hypothetical protein [Dehalobacter sp. UNSWDHB]EQB20855.1 putative membrane protein [Dehalobacter sp. UNSWDHB]
MKQQKKSQARKKLPGSSIFMYIASAFIALIAVALLVNNILYFNNTISQYTTQGYPYEMVAKELIPGQLLPGIFQPLSILGIAVVLYAAGLINQKITGYFRSCSNSGTMVDAEPTVVNTNTVNTAAEDIVSEDQSESPAAVPEQIESQTVEVQDAQDSTDNKDSTDK